MKKRLLYLGCLLMTVLTCLTACKKNDAEPVTIPDTIVEETKKDPEEPVSAKGAIRPTPAETPQPEEALGDAPVVCDYSPEQPALTGDGEIKNLSIQLGNTPEELHLTWFSKSGAAGYVNFVSQSGETCSASVTTRGSISAANYYRNRAVIKNLKANTSYQYQVGNGGAVSPVYTYTTAELRPKEFTFTITSDPEIGLGDLDDNVYALHSGDWRNSLNRMKEQIPDSRFVLSLGDHIARKDVPEEYDLFLDQSILYSVPLMPVVGNHDFGNGYWGDHFYVPNMSSHGLGDGDDGDYWFVYGNVLFMVLNNLSTCDDIEHEAFITDTIEANPNAKWRVIVSHYSPVSNIERYQGTAESVDDYFDFAEKYHIDLFLGGHDHLYTRSYIMTDDDTFLSSPDEHEFTNPQGALYVIFSTVTRSLYRNPDNYPWAAVSIQTEHPQISRASVTENSFSITTYEADTWKQLDSFTIYKD